MLDVETGTIIARPRPEVAAFVSEPDNVPKWYVNIDGVEWRSPRPLKVGTKLAFSANFLGRRLNYTYEVITYEPGESLVMRTSEGPFPMETSYMWSDTPSGGTLMRLRNRGLPRGFSRLLAPFMARVVRSANRKDLARLRDILERGARA
jgi:hypothetical protein